MVPTSEFSVSKDAFKSETHNKQAVFLLNEKTDNYIVNKLSFYGTRRLITNSFQLFLTDQYPFHNQIWQSRYISVVHCYCQDIVFYCKYCCQAVFFLWNEKVDNY